MKHNRHKKQSINRKKFESSLIRDLSPLVAQGTFFDSCVDKDATSKKYQIAKKRYLDLLTHAEGTIKEIKKMVELMESESIKEQKRSKLAEVDKGRNDKLRGLDVPEEPKHRKGWF